KEADWRWPSSSASLRRRLLGERSKPPLLRCIFIPCSTWAAAEPTADPHSRSMKTDPRLNETNLTRRRFLSSSAVAGAGFMILPGSVLGLNGATPPSGKLNIAGIGIGGQGGHDLAQMESENIVALCDVDKNHAAHTFKKYPQAKQFTDYRKMLDEMKEIDGVVVGTPDHHHAFASMEAIKRGKHVYC